MPTIRGFIAKLDIGRQALVTASVLHDDGTKADYTIADLDSDPERYNERLSKLGLLRDAMNLDEPVEIAYTAANGQNAIDAVARMTRSNLDPAPVAEEVTGTVIGIALLSRNHTGLAEASDIATIGLLDESGGARSYVLDLQIPERDVAEAQLSMLRDAQSNGATVTLGLDARGRRIIEVDTGDSAGGGDAGTPAMLDGFVERIGHGVSLGGAASMALAEVTTAPPFAGDGNVVSLVAFAPAVAQVLLVTGSPEYELFLTALRDKLRIGIAAVAPVKRGVDNPTKTVQPKAVTIADTAEPPPATPLLVRGAQLLHCLASASRPVWICVSRKSLDVGPEIACADGLPTNDLRVSTLRDLHLPYCAKWCGFGCFNHGVYRMQFDLSSRFEVHVDGKPVCLHSSDDGKTKFAHACLDGEHEICVTLPDWTCKQVFNMDIYRIR
jgi:hypothetical protein